MTSLAILLAIYVIPAVMFFGATMAVARVARWNVLLPVDYAAWIVPGLVYALTPVVIYRLEMSVPPKGLLNLVDPVIVALLCWLAFVGRILLAVRRPERNRAVAGATLALNAGIAVAVLLFVPPLPQ
jgi:hypothetical protein